MALACCRRCALTARSTCGGGVPNCRRASADPRLPVIDNRYAAVNVRLTGRGAGSGATTSGMSSPVCSADELLLITFSLQSCPTSQTPKPGVSHVRLTERVSNLFLHRIAHCLVGDCEPIPVGGPLLVGHPRRPCGDREPLRPRKSNDRAGCQNVRCPCGGGVAAANTH